MTLYRMIGAIVCLTSAVAVAGSGGPDAAGYRWVDNSEDGGPQFSYEAVNGSAVRFSDDSVAGPFNIGFDFRYYGQTYTRFWVSSNGFMTLAQNGSSGCCSGSPLGAGNGYGAMIAGYWTDLLGSAGVYRTRGEPGRRVLVFQQQGREYSQGPAVQYQIKLFEGSGAVEIHVRTAGVNGHTAAVGIQDHTRRVGLTYRSGRFNLSNTAIRFSHNSPPVLDRVAPIQVYQGQRVTFVMGMTEPDGDEVHTEVEGLPEQAMYNPLNGKFRWTPTAEDVGEHILTFRAVEQRNDQQQALSDETQVEITVLGLNQPPIISSDPPQSVVQSEELTYRLVAVDADSEDPVTCRLSEAPEDASIDDCVVTWEAVQPPGSAHDFRVVAQDSEGASSSQSFTVTVASHPDAPVGVVALESEEVGPGWFTLDASGSDPGSSESLAYRWTPLSWPEGSQRPRMENTASVQARALLTLRGVYSFILDVAGPSLDGQPVQVDVRVINVPPLAIVSEGERFELSEGDELFIALQGLDSVDPNPEDQITCDWSQVAGPDVALEQDGFDANVVLREIGDFGFELLCSDGELESEPGRVDVAVVAPENSDRPISRVPPSSGCFNVTGTQSLGLLFAVWLVGRRRRQLEIGRP